MSVLKGCLRLVMDKITRKKAKFVRNRLQIDAVTAIFNRTQARSSVVEHHLDMVVVGGSIPLVPTNFLLGVLWYR